MKLEHVANVLSEANFREGFSAFRRNNYFVSKLEHQIFRETMVFAYVQTVVSTKVICTSPSCLTSASPVVSTSTTELVGSQTFSIVHYYTNGSLSVLCPM